MDYSIPRQNTRKQDNKNKQNKKNIINYYTKEQKNKENNNKYKILKSLIQIEQKYKIYTPTKVYKI